MSKLCLLLILLCPQLHAYVPMKDRPLLAEKTPKELEGVTIDEHLGEAIDLDAEFLDDAGETVKIKNYFTGKKPVLLSIVYYDCPSLCNYHLNGLTAALKNVDWTAGEQFEIVAVSMDSHETPELALKKKLAYIKEYGRNSSNGWHFLTGKENEIQKISQSVGFKFHWDPDQKIFAHASAAYVITPEGRISRYLYGIEFNPQTVRMSLVEASNGKIGTLVDKLILFCFHFDPNENKYVLYAFNLMRVGAGLIVVVLGLVLIPMWRRKSPKGEAP